jgi:hypothetical protein
MTNLNTAMNLHQLSAVIPMLCSAFLFWCALSNDRAARMLKPTLLILAICGATYGVMVVILDMVPFRRYIGEQIWVWLESFKFFVGGIGTGAALCSLFYGHWKSAWLEKKGATMFTPDGYNQFRRGQLLVVSDIHQNSSQPKHISFSAGKAMESTSTWKQLVKV